MNNYELHLQTHTCHADCQNPICVAVRKAVAEEREACAKVCDELADILAKEQDFYALLAVEDCAENIRARGEE